MRHDVIEAARSIPKRLQDTVSAMFDESGHLLRQSVEGLKSALDKVNKYVQSIEMPKGKPGRKPGASTSSGAPVARRRRKRGRFGISEFILNELGKAPKGMRPVELAVKVSEATGKSKKASTGNVNTTLARLKTFGKVKNKSGIWSVAGSLGSGATKTGAGRRSGGRSR